MGARRWGIVAGVLALGASGLVLALVPEHGPAPHPLHEATGTGTVAVARLPAEPPPVRSANDADFTYAPGGRGAAASSITYDGRALPRLTLTVYGQAVTGTAQLSAQLTNNSASPALFPASLAVKVTVSRGGSVWQVVTIDQPPIARLGPGETATVQGSVPLDVFGTYQVGGELVGNGSSPAYVLAGT